MNFIKGIISFIKNLGRALYANTVEPVVELVKNVRARNVKPSDKRTISELLMFVALAVSLVYFPAPSFIVTLLGSYAVVTVFSKLADVCFDLSKHYKTEYETATA